MKRLAVLEGINIDIRELLFKIEMIEYYEDEIEFRAVDFANLTRNICLVDDFKKELLYFIATLDYSSETDDNKYQIIILSLKGESRINIIIESMREEECIGDEYIVDIINDIIK